MPVVVVKRQSQQKYELVEYDSGNVESCYLEIGFL